VAVGYAGIHDVIAVEGGFVAVGTRCPAAEEEACTPTVWTAGPDGRVWRVAEIDGDGSAESLARLGAGFVAVGTSDGNRAGIWTSPDAQTWISEPVDAGALAAVVASDDGVIAAGEGVLESPEGNDWMIVQDPGLEGARIWGLTRGGQGIVAVGSIFSEEEQTDQPGAWNLGPVPGSAP
jgi:hypothetical protein